MMIINSDVIVHQIFHISDIHIRLYQRMKEYQFCFDELYKTLLSKTHQDKNNMKAVLAAFLLEFKKHDDVKLVIKTDKIGFDNQVEMLS